MRVYPPRNRTHTEVIQENAHFFLLLIPCKFESLGASLPPAEMRIQEMVEGRSEWKPAEAS